MWSYFKHLSLEWGGWFALLLDKVGFCQHQHFYSWRIYESFRVIIIASTYCCYDQHFWSISDCCIWLIYTYVWLNTCVWLSTDKCGKTISGELTLSTLQGAGYNFRMGEVKKVGVWLLPSPQRCESNVKSQADWALSLLTPTTELWLPKLGIRRYHQSKPEFWTRQNSRIPGWWFLSTSALETPLHFGYKGV